jgi:hypothetical protein
VGVSIASLIAFTTAAELMGISTDSPSCGCAVAGKELPENLLAGLSMILIVLRRGSLTDHSTMQCIAIQDNVQVIPDLVRNNQMEKFP